MDISERTQAAQAHYEWFGLQRSFGLNILELLAYYLMPNKCKNLKDMKSSTFALSKTGAVDRAKLTTLPRESDVLSI